MVETDEETSLLDQDDPEESQPGLGGDRVQYVCVSSVVRIAEPSAHPGFTRSVLVPADAVETGEKLVLQVYDSDLYNSDDSLGKIEVDLTDLVQEGNEASSDGKDTRGDRRDALQPLRQGGKAKGSLTWSVRFHPVRISYLPFPDASAWADGEVRFQVWRKKMEEDEDDQVASEAKPPSKEDNMAWPIWHSAAEAVLKPDPLSWEEERLKRRRESVRWLKGQRKREALEAQEKPSKEKRSGILAWSIVQCQGSSLMLRSA